MSKKLAEHNRRVRDERKEEGGLKRFEAVHSELEPDTEPSSSFSLTQILSVVSMVLSLAGLYYKRKELMALVNKPQPKPQAQTKQTQIPVRVKAMN